MEQEYNRDAVIQSYVEQYVIINTLIRQPNYIAQAGVNNFLMTTHEGLTLGINMVTGVYRTLMLGWSDSELIKLCEGMDDYEVSEMREKLNDGETIKQNFTNIFFVPDMDYAYYEKAPLVSVELVIPADKEIDTELVTGLADALEAATHHITKYFGEDEETAEDDEDGDA